MPALDVKDALTKKIGPLPGFAWAGIVGGSILVVRVMRGSTGAKGSTATPGSAGSIDLGTGSSVGSGGSGGSSSDGTDTTNYTQQLNDIKAALTAENDYLAKIQHILKHPTDTTEPPTPTPGPIPQPTGDYLKARLHALIAKLDAAQTAFHQADARVTNLQHKLNDPTLTHRERRDLKAKLAVAEQNRSTAKTLVNQLQAAIASLRLIIGGHK